MRRLLVSIIAVLLISNLNYAQQVSLSGYIFDKDLNEIEAAAVSICKSDSTTLISTLSDKDGFFQLNYQGSRGGYLYIKHIDCQTYFSPISVLSDTAIKIYLNPISYQLDEAVVVSESKVVTFQDGNLVYSVSKIPGSETSNLNKIMVKLPGVSTRDGLTLNGTGATLYIDGVKQQMVGSNSLSQILESMPASIVEQVELISNPAGLYDASSGAVINIKTKKQYSDGYSLNIGVSGYKYDHSKYSGETNAYLMLKKGRVSMNTMFSYSNDYSRTELFDSTTYKDQMIVTIDRLNTVRTNVFSFMNNLSIRLNKNRRLGLFLYIYDDFGKSALTWPTTIVDPNGITIPSYLSKTKTKSNDDLWSAKLEYKSSDSSLTRMKASYGFLYGGLRSDNDYFKEQSIEYDKFMYSNLEMIGYQHTLAIDLSQDIGNKFTLDAGLKADIGKLKDDATYEYIGGSGSYPTSHFVGYENIIAAYTRLRLKPNNKWLLSASIRTEYTDYDINHKSENSKTNNRYWDVFPYASISLTTNNYQTTLAFASGIVRPNYEWMLPGVRYTDEYSYTIGNPNLNPVKQYALAWNNLFFDYINVLVRFNHTKDWFGSVLYDTNQGKTAYSYQNYADQNRFYVRLSLPFQLFEEKLSGSINGMVRWTKYYHFKNGYSIPLGRSDSSWDNHISGSILYQITKNVGIHTYAYYNSENSTPQYNIKSYWGVDAGLFCSFLKKDILKISLDVENIFDSDKRKQYYFYEHNLKYQKFYTPSRLIKISIRVAFSGGAKIKNEEMPSDIPNDIGRFSNR